MPLTHREPERKRYALQEAFELAKEIQDENTMVFVLAGMLVFADKVIDKEIGDRVKGWLSMTKVARLFEQEKEAALAVKDAIIAEKDEAIAEKDEAIANRDVIIANREARIKDLEAQLALAGIQI